MIEFCGKFSWSKKTEINSCRCCFYFFLLRRFFFLLSRWTWTNERKKNGDIHNAYFEYSVEWVRNWVRERQAHTCDLLPRYQSIVVLLILIVRRIRNLSLGRHGPSTHSLGLEHTAHARSPRWFDVCLDARRREANPRQPDRDTYNNIGYTHRERNRQ